MSGKKWAVAAGMLIAVLACAYAAASWYVGRQVEAGLSAAYAGLKHYGPYVAVGKRIYERGVFSARETVSVSVFAPDPLRPPRALVSFIIVSRIRHLPLSRLSAPRAAAIDSTVNFVPGSLPEEELWTGGEDLAHGHTEIALRGAVRTTLTIPAFNAPRLSSEPAKLTLDFPAGLARYAIKGSAPRFTVQGDHGERMQISGVRLEGSHQRMLADVPDMYAGVDRLTIASIEAAAAGAKTLAVVRDAAVEMSATPRDGGEFMDTAIKYSLAQATVAGNSFGPAELEVAVRHLHTRAFASLSRLDASAGGGGHARKRKERDANDLLLNRPEITGKLRFTVPEGDTVVSAQAGLHDLTAADLAGNGADLRNKVDLTVDARAPAALVMDEHGRPLPVYEPLARMLHLPLDGGALHRLIAEGYISRDGNDLQTRFLFRNGRYWFNGKEYAVPGRRPGTAGASR
ncbi:MAG TPA: DUF945 family protein [Gallionellaceae bacterium]|nr:DUF945 family protein [Gallionellaceae bacterium]